MASAAIVIQQSDSNSISISRDDLALNVLVTLLNQNNTGVSTWLWEMVDKPEGSSASLSSTTISTTTFTPDVEGTYLIKLVVNGTIIDQKGAAIKTANLNYRIPAALEDLEFDVGRGWATGLNDALKKLDDAYGNLLGSGSGTVTDVATNSTLTGGPITTTGTLGINLSHANTWAVKQTFSSHIAVDGYTIDISSGALLDQVLKYNGASFVAAGGDTSWTNLTLLNSWADLAPSIYGVAGFMKDSTNNVELKGVIVSGTNGTIAVLPSGYRPSEDRAFVVWETGTGHAQVIARANGTLDCDTSGTVVSLAGITFNTLP